MGPDEVVRPLGPCIDRCWEIIARLDELMLERPSAPLYSNDLARRIGISPRTLQSAVRVVFGLSLHRYIRLTRLWSAHRFLQSGCRSVKDAALRNGFSHFGDFARLYKEVFGEAPSETLSARNRRSYRVEHRANETIRLDEWVGNAIEMLRSRELKPSDRS